MRTRTIETSRDETRRDARRCVGVLLIILAVPSTWPFPYTPLTPQRVDLDARSSSQHDAQSMSTSLCRLVLCPSMSSSS